MEKYIEEVINADRLAREKVANAKKQLKEISGLVSSSSQDVYKKLMDEEKKELEIIQENIQREIDEVRSNCEKEKKAGLDSLEERFNAHREEWIEQIVANCIQ